MKKIYLIIHKVVVNDRVFEEPMYAEDDLVEALKDVERLRNAYEENYEVKQITMYLKNYKDLFND